MAPKEKKTKAQIAAAAAAGGKVKKKKWSKAKQADKLCNAVIFDQATYDRLLSEIPKCKLITPSIISERLRINVSLARQGIKELESLKLIKCVGERHHAQLIYTRATAGGDENERTTQ